MYISTQRVVCFVSLLVFGVIMRLVPHPSNVTPVFALALLAPMWFPRRYAYMLPLLTLFVSDLLIGWYTPMVMLAVYGSALMTVFLGSLHAGSCDRRFVYIFSLASSILFFVVSNAAVWAFTPLYPQTLFGLGQSYLFALPFFRNELAGTLLYSALLFECTKLVSSRLSIFRIRAVA